PPPDIPAAATIAPTTAGHARRARLSPDVIPTPASGLFHDPDVGDRHRLVRGLDHVVDGEGSHRHRVQRLHLRPRASLRPDPGLDLDAVAARPHVDVDAGEGQRATARDAFERG